MDISSLEKTLKDNKLNSLYLLYGEEKYLLENILSKILKIFGDKINGINFINLDGTSIENIIADIETPAFGYPKKLILVKDSQLFKKQSRAKKSSNKEEGTDKKENKLVSKIANYIEENMKMINDSIVLVFVESDVDKNELYKTIEKNGIVCEFVRLKLPDILKRLKSICNAYKVHVDENTLRYFVEVCGTNMQDLINEIRKQIEYAGENGTITKNSIDLLAIKQLDSIIFDLTDNLGRKNITQALEVLKNMIYAKEPIQKILITLYNHFKKLYFTKIAIQENKNIVESLKLKPNQTFLVSKYTTQSKYFKEKELKDILQEFIDLDSNSKSGKIDINVGLEAILCKYCS